MPSLCAVPQSESRRIGLRSLSPPAGGGERSYFNYKLIRNLRLQLARLLDDLLDRLLGWQNVNELAPGIDVFHVLRQPGWIAQCEFTYRGDARGAQQAGLGLAHAGNSHVVANI